MVDGSMALNLTMAGCWSRERESRACPANLLPPEHKRKPLAVTADSRRRGGRGDPAGQEGGRGAGVKQQGSGQCQLAKPGRMKHPGIRGSRTPKKIGTCAEYRVSGCVRVPLPQ